MKITKINSVLLLALMIVFSASVCGCMAPKQEKENVRIEVQMFSGPEHEAMVPAAKYWNDNYAAKTGITVDVEALERVGYSGKMLTQLIGGLSTPDVLHPFSLQLGELMPYLEPLNPYLNDKQVMTSPTGEELSVDQLLEPALNNVATTDGTIYMLPKDMSEVILYYRKDLIPDPPDTWEEYVKVAKQFTRSINPESPTKYGTIMQGKYELWTFCAALENIWPYGGNIFVPGTSAVDLDITKTSKGFKIFEDLARADVFPPGVINAEHPQVAQIVASGDVAMAMQWNAFYPEFLAHEEKCPAVYGKFDIAPPPGVRKPDGEIVRNMYMQTICLALNKKSQHKIEAMKFMAWVALGEGASIYADAGGSSPTKSVWESSEVSVIYPRIAKWVKEFGRAAPYHPKISEIILMGSNWVQKVIAGVATAEDAAQGLKSDVERYLQK